MRKGATRRIRRAASPVPVADPWLSRRFWVAAPQAARYRQVVSAWVVASADHPLFLSGTFVFAEG